MEHITGGVRTRGGRARSRGVNHGDAQSQPSTSGAPIGRGRARGRTGASASRGRGRRRGRVASAGTGTSVGIGRGDVHRVRVVAIQNIPSRISAVSMSTLLPSTPRPEMQPLEQPLTNRRRRNVPERESAPAPSAAEASPVVASSSNISSSNISSSRMDEGVPPTPQLAPASPFSFVPSPAAYTEVGGHSSVVSPSPASSRLQLSLPLNDDQLENYLDQLCFGSDDDSGAEDDDGSDRLAVGDGMSRWQAEEEFVAETEEAAGTPNSAVDVGTEVAPAMTLRTGVSMLTVACQTDPIVEPTTAFDMVWTAFPANGSDEHFRPERRREVFQQQTGPTATYNTPYEAFTAIWDRCLVDRVVQQTNLFAVQLDEKMTAQGIKKPCSRINRWKNTSVDELYMFFGVILSMGIVVKACLEDYWNTAKNIFSTPGVAEQISINRFKLLSRCIHFNDDSQRPSDASSAQARIFKIEPLVTYLNNKFSSLYNLSQNIAIDESLLKYLGRLAIRQFIRNKAASVGIKTYELCESVTGYLWRFEVHAESLSTNDRVEAALSGAIPTLVLRLLEGLEHRGHTVWMDNFYNSPALARIMKAKGFDCAGTLRTDRQLVPVELNTLRPNLMVNDGVYGCTSGDVDILVWKDKRRVALISTYHGNHFVRAQGRTILGVVHDYNLRMGGVDKKDQMLSMYPVERTRGRFWYKKFFRRLLNVSVLNALTLFNHNRHKKVTHRQFRQQLVLELLARHGTSNIRQEQALRIVMHFPKQTPRLPSGYHAKLLCKWCGKRTTYRCTLCDKTFCYEPCFEEFHATLIT